jgi:signal transduction histidine kinase
VAFSVFGVAWLIVKGEVAEMGCGPAPDNSAVDASLVEWRHRAANSLMAASAVVYLPAVALMVAGKGPPVAWSVQATMLAGYAVTVFCAALRGTDYRTRAWVFMTAGYAATVVGNIAAPQGPFVRALPVVLPMITMVLFGARAGRAATAVSIAVLLFAPLLNGAPLLVGIITTASAEAPVPPGVTWTQSAVLTALLVALMILLDRFHQFLMQSLAGLEQEAAGRRDAYHDLEREMAERKRLEREVARVGDEERRRLGHEIHDGVCQQLTGALLRSEAMARRVGRGETPAPEEYSALSSLLEETIDEAHGVAKGLCPLGADAGALETAVRTLVRRTSEASGIACSIEVAGDVTVTDAVTAQHLYRVAQEAVSNAMRHAHAGRIAVALRGDAEGLLLAVEDDGDGLPEGNPAEGMGLRTMAYRAGLLEGEFAIGSGRAGGTRVFFRVPRSGLAGPEAKESGVRIQKKTIHED